MCGILTKRMF